MSTPEITKNPFSFNPQTEESDYHLFTCSHPYMVGAGLGVFTTGTLMKWWNRQSSDNEFPLAASFLTGGAGWSELLGINSNTEFSWQGFKKDLSIDNFGIYEPQGLNGFMNHSAGESWSYDTESFGLLDHEDVNSLIEAQNLGSFNNGRPIFEVNVVYGGSLQGEDFKPKVVKSGGELLNLGVLFNLINLNRYMAAFEDLKPLRSWNLQQLGNTAGIPTKDLVAARQLLLEIMTSKGGPSIDWASDISVRVGDIGPKCIITEKMSFKLFLFKNSTPLNSQQGVAFSTLKFASPKRTATGKVYGDSSEDGYTVAGQSQIAADLNVHYNQVTHQLEAGSKILLAKLTTSLPAASSPSSDTLIAGTISKNLSDAKTSIIPKTGIALPIFSTNGNPIQWQPNYKNPKCGDSSTNNQKETLVVYNFSDKRSYIKDENVNLISIDGIWHVNPIDPPPPIEDQLNSVEELKWGEFTYFMTTSDFFFRRSFDGNSISRDRFSPGIAEASFHGDYYVSYRNNDWDEPGKEQVYSLNYSTTYGTEGGYDNKFDNRTPTLFINHAYCQVTSFDFLDSNIFGIRGINSKNEYVPSLDKCSIAYTNANKDSRDRNIVHPPEEYATRNAAHCGIFFGCLFPEGYTGFNSYNEPRDFDISLGTPNDNTEFPYFSIAVSNNEFLPFNPASSRSNCRQPTFGSVNSESFNSDELAWERAKEELSESIFYNQESLNSVPADVMLNASLSGENGSPLYPIHRFNWMHNPDDFLENNLKPGRLLNLVSQTFNSCGWLAKAFPGGSKAGRRDISAFDFKPVNPNHIMFRPLKFEAYTQFYPRTDDTDDAKNLEKNTSRRIFLLLEGYRTQMDYTRPISDLANQREASKNVKFNILSQGEQRPTDFNRPMLFGFWGLLWGGSVWSKPSYRNIHRGSYWGGTARAFNLGFAEGAMNSIGTPHASLMSLIFSRNSCSTRTCRLGG
jgi:hypothetical protein